MIRVPAVVLVALLCASAVLAGASVGSGPRLAAANETAPLPGSQYTGVVGAQGVEVEAAYDRQAFGVRFADATTNESKAAVVAAEVEAIRDRLAELESRREALANGSGDAFEEDGASARTTTFVAESVALANRIDRVEGAAATLPDQVREDHGIAASVFGALADRAAALTTAEMVEVAHEVAGEDVGEDLDEVEEDEDGDDGDGDESEDGETTDESDGTESDGDSTETTESDGGSDSGDGDSSGTTESDGGDGGTSSDGDGG